ncbi:tRNA-specific adenosine deaminase 1 isoform X1 [Dermacentor andersoni]|uniref:tRNA-specific adenosine deaminase 1 isoform X1 n=1 Tax=Dermacentor andersoni TaxID=34620 RepID=UPI0021555FED|nr:tRNA-specific adenosine deaminase 1-like isoform X2 [Dermacentor andersoni]
MAFCLKRKETSLSSSVQQRLYVGANAMRHIDDFAETVTSVCYRAYDDLPKTGKPSRGCEWTLLSAVLLQDVNQATLQIVSFATGTKSIPTGLACRLGNQVIDNHAEVLARRCFLRFAYSELLKLACGEDSSVFETTGSSVFECRLKPGLRIHFFSSHTPCGDASIFPKNGDVLSVAALEDTENDATASKRPRLDPEDIYRTGAKCVPGTAQDKKLPGADYHQLGVARTKPGRGATSLSMSCSDKMAKWHSCGLEGALLSHFLAGEEPLRLSSVIVAGCPYSEDAMKRALHERLSVSDDVPPIEFHYSTKMFCHSRLKAVENNTDSAVPCASSIMWWLGSDKAVYVGVNGYKQGITRKNLCKPVARLPVCRRELFGLFHKLMHEISPDRLPKILREDDLRTYAQFKQAAKVYQNRKVDFHARLPGWTDKSPDLQNFTIAESV